MNRRSIGTDYETIALSYLMDKGHELVVMNYRIRTGEVDLITKDGNYLVFTEVKYRKNNKMGAAAEAVNRKKQQKIVRTAMHFLLANGYRTDTPCRFDVIAVEDNHINHIENAFEVETWMI